MPFRIKLTLAAFLALLLLALVGPFLVPVPELKTVPVRQLTDPDSRFAELGALAVHYKEHGEEEPALILLHGFGGSTLSWKEVLEPLGNLRRTVAFDRPAFGLTERPRVERDVNPYTPEAQLELLVELMDALGIERAVLVGNSSGGTLAVQAALEHPERVAGLVLVGAAVYSGGGAPGWARPLLSTPQADRLGPLIMRQLGGEPGLEFLRGAYADPERVTEAVIRDYRRPLQAEGWDEALWELTKASREADWGPRLRDLRVPTLVVSGAQDAIVPPEASERLSREVPGAAFKRLGGCGHLPQQECPEAFVAAVSEWLEGTFRTQRGGL